MANLENEKVVRRFYDAFNKKDPGIIKEVISTEYVDFGHQPSGRGVQGALDDYQAITKSIGDIVFNIDEMISVDDRVIVQWSSNGKHTGEFLGIPATQKSINLVGMSIYRLRDGKILETRNSPNLLMPVIQLGLFVPGGAKAA
jgi:steroid delta-isomerase-like uncharacterized protein